MDWPKPAPPLEKMRWADEPGRWSAVGPTGLRWRIDALTDGRYAVTVGDWTTPDRVVDTLAAAQTLVETFEARHDDPAVEVLGVSWSEASAAQDAFAAAAEARVTEWFWGPAHAGWERFEP